MTVVCPRAHWHYLIPAIVFFTNTSDAQSHSPLSAVTRQSNEQTVMSLLWKNILTTCPVRGATPAEYSYFYTGLLRQGRVLYEYREPADPKEMIRPDNISTADRLNGTEWHGSIIWVCRGLPYIPGRRLRMVRVEGNAEGRRGRQGSAVVSWQRNAGRKFNLLPREKTRPMVHRDRPPSAY